MADVTVKAQLEGLAKEVYADGVVNLIPDHAKLIKKIPFRESEMLGNAYNQPVVVSDENGVTYAGSEDDAFDLESPEAMQTKNAQIKGSQIVMRAAIGYKAAAAIASKGPKAFLNSTEFVIKRLMASAGTRLEIAALYGQSGLGRSTSSANVDANDTNVTITALTWAPGIWIGRKNAKLSFFNDSGTAIGTDQNVYQLVSVNVASRIIKVSGSPTDIANLDAAAAAGVNAYFKGAKGKEMLGLDGIITTSGSLFGIDNSVYDLFKGRSFSAGSANLSFDKLTSAIVESVNFGLDGDVDVLVSPTTWAKLVQDEAALRNYDKSYSPAKAEKGNEDLVFHSQAGKLAIVSHSFIKEGEAFIVQMDDLRRVGAYDLSMRNPGRNNEMFRELEDKAGFELRAYTDQAIFCAEPAHLTKVTNIVNS